MATAHHLQKLLHAANSRIARIRENGEEIMGESIAMVETVGAAGLASSARARLGEDGRILIGGLDADLLAGLALHAVAFAGGFGSYDEHAHSIGTGFLSCWAVHKMYEMGLEAKNEAASTSGNVLPMGMPHATTSEFDQAWAHQRAA